MQVVLELLADMENDSDLSLLFDSSESSDTSLSSDVDDDVPPSIKKARIENYLHVIENYTDLQFKKHFRLTRVVAEMIIGMWF